MLRFHRFFWVFLVCMAGCSPGVAELEWHQEEGYRWAELPSGKSGKTGFEELSLRRTGITYREMEEQGTLLAVTEARVRYRQAARYDDLVRLQCWVREVASRRVTFGYAVERAATDELLATGETSLVALDRAHALSRLPEHVRAVLRPSPDPVRL